MPQRKGRQSNKKKSKGRAGHGQQGNRGAATRSTPSSQRPSNNNIASIGSVLEGQKPSNFNDYEERRRQAIQDNYDTFYSRYKEATKRFCDFMINTTPQTIEGNRNSVNFLVIAADWMVETSFVLNPLVLKDLKLAIRMRSRVAKSIFGGGDAGHSHLISVLMYCWTNLISLPRWSDSKQSAEEMGEIQQQQENRYESLMGDDDEEDEMDEEVFPSTPVPRPEPEPEIALTIEQLKTSDERNDAVLFLLTLDELMGYVADQYQTVAKNYLNYQKMGAPASALVEEFLEAAVATNMAIQQVQQLEYDLQQQYEHLTTPYRLLSTLVMPEMTQRIAQIVREHGKTEKKPGLEQETIIFLGDCLECNIRAKSDPSNQKDTIVQDFCTKFEVDETGSDEIHQIFMALESLVVLEMPLKGEKQGQSVLRRAAQSNFGESLPQGHSWLQRMPFIGGDRAIHHTIRLLQAFGPVIISTPDNKSIQAKRGFFGPSPWRPGHARKIHGDLDELFMADILPQWVLMCRKGILGNMKLPRETELCPLFVLLRQYVENPHLAVTWSLAFAMHAMLTSILETDRITNELINMSDVVFNNYFSQLEFAVKLSEKEPEMMKTNKLWHQNMFTVAFLKNLGLEIFGRHAIWNPLCGGTIFSYLCFFGNLEAGCTLIDCQAQLRITLHLFHALKVNGILRKGQLPMLDTLHDCFKSSRGVWEGPLPQKGEFVQRFWICFGMTVTHAKQMVEKSKLAVRRHKLDTKSDKNSWKRRKMKPIEPAEIATSYRRICNRDFHDVIDKYHTEEQRRRSKGTDMYSFAVRANDTLDAIDNEQKLLAFNLPSCGALLEQFVCSLGIILQWEPLLVSSDPTLSGHKRQGFVVLFAQHLLGALDFAYDPLDHEFLNVPMGRASAHFMSNFFGRLDPSKALWFTPVEEED